MSTDSLKVLIIAGGLTHERDVSVRSGRRVANSLINQGFDAKVVDFDQNLPAEISAFGPDVVWPLVHGSLGEDGSLQSLLEGVGVPYVGSTPAQAMLASNKPTAKALVGAAGLDTPGWIALPQLLFRQLGAHNVLGMINSSLTFPLVVKPSSGGSALGMSRAQDSSDLRSAMVDAFSYEAHVLLERFVEGRDIAVSVVDLEEGPIALPPVEVSTDDGHYDYEARYTTDESEYFVPARLSNDEMTDVQAAAIQIHELLGLRDLSRIDFIVDDNGSFWFIDANVSPGMTDTSLFPQAAEATGSFDEICAAIVRYVASRD